MFFKKNLGLIILFVLSLIPLIDLFHLGLPITHDGQDHVARIANFYQNLTEGNIIPRWAANLNWGYGHPILMFLYPLPSYLASFFHFLGFSLVDSTKIVFGLGYVLSGIFMYLWLREFLGEESGFIGGILYLFAPYRFVDLYVRGAIGEHIAFVFPPLVLYFILKLSKKYSPWFIIGGSFAFAGLILSHNAISLMFLPLFFAYIFYLFWQTNLRKIFLGQILFLMILGFGLSSFFWMPAFLEGKYTLRDIVTKGAYASHFVNVWNFFYSQWNYGGSGVFSVQIGIGHWLMVILGIPTSIFLYKRKNRLWLASLGLLIIFMTTLFLMTQQSRVIWETIKTIQKFQFPWRLLSITVFTTATLGALFTFVLKQKWRLPFILFLLSLVLFFSKNQWLAKGYLIVPSSFFNGVYFGTTDTGESSPLWSVRFMEKPPLSHLEAIEGRTKISELSRLSTEHKYKVETFERVRFRENTLYFPGWQVLVDGMVTQIEFQDPQNRGLITFFVEKGVHVIDIQFRETKLRTIADIISLVSLIFIVLIPFSSKNIWRCFR